MSFQEDEKEIVEINYKQPQKESLSSIEFNIGDTKNNVNSISNSPRKDSGSTKEF